MSKAIPHELATIVSKAIEKNPQDRYLTAGELSADLRRWLGDQPIKARPPTLRQRGMRWARRNRALVAATVFVLVTALVAASSFGWLYLQQLAETERQVELALQEATIFQGEAKWPVALAAITRAETLLESGNVTGTFARRTRDLRRDIETAAKLEDIRLQYTGIYGNAPHKSQELARATADYDTAFRLHGINLQALTGQQAAELIRTQAISGELIAALDHWARLQIHDRKTNDWKKLIEIARLADRDDWRKRFRFAVEQGDVETLKAMACSEQAKALHPSTLGLLASTLGNMGAEQEKLALLREAQWRQPGDYWINVGLAELGPHQLDLNTQVRYLTAALASRPQSPDVHGHLAWRLLQLTESRDEALFHLREMFRIRPDQSSYKGFVSTLEFKGLLDEAEAVGREWIRQMPNDEVAYSKLVGVLVKKGLLDEAEAVGREWIRRMPNNPAAHSSLAGVLVKKGLLEEAKASFQQVRQLNPNEQD